MDDPKLRVRPAPEPEPVSQTDFLSAMKLLIAEMRSAQTDEAKEGALKQAEILQQILVKTRPENTEHPEISAFSHPEGDRARPKPDLKCKMFWVGYPLTKETLTPTEVDLLNRLVPVDTRVTKADGTKIRFQVLGKRSDADPTVLEELSIQFPCKNDHRQNHGSMVSYLQQALGDAIPSVDELMVEVTRLRAELASAMTGAGRV